LDRDKDTYDSKNPPNSLVRPRAHSTVLWAFVASVVGFLVLVAVAWVFWTVAHPRPSVLVERERSVGSSGGYFVEGGHDPNPRPGSTRDELRFRGALTPPSEVRGGR
jgi:hypothetical protein